MSGPKKPTNGDELPTVDPSALSFAGSISSALSTFPLSSSMEQLKFVMSAVLPWPGPPSIGSQQGRYQSSSGGQGRARVGGLGRRRVYSLARSCAPSRWRNTQGSPGGPVVVLATGPGSVGGAAIPSGLSGPSSAQTQDPTGGEPSAFPWADGPPKVPSWNGLTIGCTIETTTYRRSRVYPVRLTAQPADTADPRGGRALDG